jgi:hypothetical protein
VVVGVEGDGAAIDWVLEQSKLVREAEVWPWTA